MPMRPPPASPRRPARWSLRIVGIAVVGLLAYLLFDSALSVVRAGIALAGYVLVGFLSYSVGRWVGRRRALRSP